VVAANRPEADAKEWMNGFLEKRKPNVGRR